VVVVFAAVGWTNPLSTFARPRTGFGGACVAMHWGLSTVMRRAAVYDEVVATVVEELSGRSRRCSRPVSILGG
jgi:hypothetical protein